MDLLTNILALSCAAIFFSISILHFYWAAGGKWGMQGALPESYKADFFNPKNKILIDTATIAIGLGLAVFGVILLSHSFSIDTNIIRKNRDILTLTIGIIFLLRAIGDFKVFGLFKKKTDSLFNKMDRKFYVPLCLFLGSSCIALKLLN